jgi:hypothetical protein
MLPPGGPDSGPVHAGSAGPGPLAAMARSAQPHELATLSPRRSDSGGGDLAPLVDAQDHGTATQRGLAPAHNAPVGAGGLASGVEIPPPGRPEPAHDSLTVLREALPVPWRTPGELSSSSSREDPHLLLSIGQVVVHTANPPVTASAPQRPPARTRVSLAEYLAARARSRR